MHRCTHAYINTYILTCIMYTCIHQYINAYIPTYIHKNIHTYF